VISRLMVAVTSELWGRRGCDGFFMGIVSPIEETISHEKV
jgi:hypothetical protein